MFQKEKHGCYYATFREIVSAPFEIKHTASDINSLVELINSVEGESRIVMEHTGRYYEVLAHQLSEANLFRQCH